MRPRLGFAPKVKVVAVEKRGKVKKAKTRTCLVKLHKSQKMLLQLGVATCPAVKGQ